MTTRPPAPAPVPRNPQTHARHRREVLWQVFVPLIVGVLLVVALAVGIGLSSRGGTRVWADVSLIWLMIPALVAALIPLAVLVALIWALMRLLGLLPGWMFQVQEVFRKINAGVRRGADRIASPVIRARSQGAALRALRHVGDPLKEREQ